MIIGHCPSCGHAYSPRDVEIYGVLRARPAQRGGPRMEYRCSRCNHLVHLVPHGRGRYARPGQPPGPAPREEDLRPEWFDPARPEAEAPAGPEGPSAAPRPHATAPPAVPYAVQPPIPPTIPPPVSRRPPTLEEARALLGVDAGADAPTLDQAFRERSLTCHPDKTAHLDEDFQRLAEAKFLRLRAAYDLLAGGGTAH